MEDIEVKHREFPVTKAIILLISRIFEGVTAQTMGEVLFWVHSFFFCKLRYILTSSFRSMFQLRKSFNSFRISSITSTTRYSSKWIPAASPLRKSM